jgi:hypothetical protein
MRRNIQHAPARRRWRLWPPIVVLVAGVALLVWELTFITGALIGGAS